MNEAAIIAENLGKTYTLDKERPRTFKEYAGRMLNGRNKSQLKEIMALDGVSFQVNKGEAIGVIGANGSGKSTLLRVLGGITRPSSGRAILHGRVASVLDLGTGFHPDLSGMENIYLNGEMMGMNREEIHKRVDEIIAFSELEQFIDTPVKYYSSGMFVRLAFSVIAHLQSDILLLDEVLSVGDAAFQIKSFNKMQELLGSGQTILLVSHNLNSLFRFTNRCLYLQNGTLSGQGKTDEIIAAYSDSIFYGEPVKLHEEISGLTNFRIWDNPGTAPGNEFIRLRKILVRNENRTVDDQIYVDEKIVIEIDFEKLDDKEPINIALRVNDVNGNPLFIASPLLSDKDYLFDNYNLASGNKYLKCKITNHLFNGTKIFIDVLFIDSENNMILSIPYALTLTLKLNENEKESILYRLTNYPLSPLICWTKSK